MGTFSLPEHFFIEGVMMKLVAALLSLTVCHGYYIYQHPFFHAAPQYWFLRGPPGISPIVVGLPTPEEFVCPKDGTFPNLENACDSYYICSNGNVWERTCNPGLKFDGSSGQCNWAREVDENCNWHEDAISIGKGIAR